MPDETNGQHAPPTPQKSLGHQPCVLTHDTKHSHPARAVVAPLPHGVSAAGNLAIAAIGLCAVRHIVVIGGGTVVGVAGAGKNSAWGHFVAAMMDEVADAGVLDGSLAVVSAP